MAVGTSIAGGGGGGGGGVTTTGGTSTDNAVARFDGTNGTKIQTSNVILDDGDNITGVQALTINADFTASAGVATVLETSVGLGSATGPGYTFTGDTNTGIYSPGADVVAVTAGGKRAANFNTAATAVNYVDVTPSAAGAAVIIAAAGTDSNIGISLAPKGTGGVVHPAGAVATPSVTTTGDLDTGAYFPAANTVAIAAGGVDAARFNTAATAVNYLNVTPSAATSPVIVAAAGTDSNIGINITPKGTGATTLPAGSALAWGTTAAIKDVGSATFQILNAPGASTVAGHIVLRTLQTYGSDGSTQKFRLSGTTTAARGTSDWVYGWTASTSDADASLDTGVSRVSAGVVGVGTGATTSVAGTIQFASDVVVGSSGATWTRGYNTELLTLSTSGTTTDTSANLLPANSVIESVVARVTTTIATATDWKLGDPTTAGRFTAANATLTANTTDVGILHWSGAVTTLAAGPSQASAAKVRVTTTGTPSAGIVRITVFFRTFVPPTS